jgi:hypothetical protein
MSWAFHSANGFAAAVFSVAMWIALGVEHPLLHTINAFIVSVNLGFSAYCALRWLQPSELRQ